MKKAANMPTLDLVDAKISNNVRLVLNEGEISGTVTYNNLENINFDDPSSKIILIGNVKTADEF